MTRRILVLAHTGRHDAMAAAQEACTRLHASGLTPVMRAEDLRDIQESGYLSKLTAGIVLSGGAAALPGMGELAADLFGTAVRVAVPKENVTGLADAF